MNLTSQRERGATQVRTVRPRLELLEDRSVPSAVAVEVEDFGVWRFEDATDWRQLTPADVDLLAINARGDVAAEIEHFGVWRFEDATNWQQLTPTDVTSLALNDSGSVAVAINDFGVW